MATVFKAYHPALDRDVAIKVLHATFKNSSGKRGIQVNQSGSRGVQSQRGSHQGQRGSDGCCADAV